MEKKDDGGDGVGRGGIGAGGGKRKGKNIPNERKAEAEARRKAQQDLPQQHGEPLPLRDFGDGSRLIRDWSHTHKALLGDILLQEDDICWALVLAIILQFIYNMGRPIAEQHLLDINGFIEKVKLTEEEIKAQKKLDSREMAVGSLKKAMDIIFDTGLGKIDGRKRKEGAHSKVFAIKGRFLEVEEATPQEIAEKVEQGPVGLIIDDTVEFHALTEGIYMVPKPTVGAYKHAVTVVAYGTMNNGELFFEVQNTWGTTWGVGGCGRIVISSTCHLIYLDEVVDEKKKKKKKKRAA